VVGWRGGSGQLPEESRQQSGAMCFWIHEATGQVSQDFDSIAAAWAAAPGPGPGPLAVLAPAGCSPIGAARCAQAAAGTTEPRLAS
jgi:hypothetical protein